MRSLYRSIESERNMSYNVGAGEDIQWHMRCTLDAVLHSLLALSLCNGVTPPAQAALEVSAKKALTAV